MKVVIRADASIHIGSGHIMRCLVLAYALKEQGHQVSFASRPQQGDLINFVQAKGFTVNKLVTPKYWQTPKYGADYASWLQVPWLDDAQSLFDNINSLELLIVDHYALNNEWESLVKMHYSCKIVAIDDLVRQHQADIIIDQTLLRQADEYKLPNPNSIVLTGTDYALLNPLFVVYRKELLTRHKVLSKPTKVLITMGGIDLP